MLGMNIASQLPAWVTYLQALSVPILSAAAVIITALQVHISRKKYKLDVFARRYDERLSVYTKTLEMYEKCIDKTISQADMDAYRKVLGIAMFIFEKDVNDFLKTSNKKIRFILAYKKFSQGRKDSNQSDEHEKYCQNIKWIADQGPSDSEIVGVFSKYLSYEKSAVYTPLICKTLP